MNISRSSWHYRLYHKFRPFPPSNLCDYMGFFPLILLFAVLVLFLIGMVGFTALVLPFTSYHWKGLWFFAGYAMIALLTIVIGKWSETNSANVLGEYLRAKKAGICPKINVVD